MKTRIEEVEELISHNKREIYDELCGIADNDTRDWFKKIFADLISLEIEKHDLTKGLK